MTRLTIDDNLVASLITEVAPLVSRATGWELNLPTLLSRVLPREQGYESIVEAKLRLLGYQVSPQRDFVTRTVEMLIEKNVLAAYEPLANELMLIRENVDDSNLDGLRLVLAHELTHRGQHVNHPQLFQRVNDLLLSVLKEAGSGEVDFQKMRGFFEQVKPLMTLIESHASYIQGILNQKYYPQAQIEKPFSLPVLIFRVLGFGKTTQYTAGLPQVSQADQKGGIDSLFNRLAGV
jgi:hypothetical protein